MRPTRSTADGRTYLDLQRLAVRTRRQTSELLELYALEGLLDRLAASTHSGRFVLKGGALLAAYDARRPTRDIDLHAAAPAHELDEVLEVVRSIAALEREDGLMYDTDAATARPIRDDQAHPGVRVQMTASLSRARIVLHVDVNVGDPVQPPPVPVTVPRLLGGELVILGYPLTMVLAEKLVTAVQRGSTNTRWRDYADVHILSRRQDVSGDALMDSLQTVASHRGQALSTLAVLLVGYAVAAQPRWARWRSTQGLADRLPLEFADVLDQVQALADPALAGTVRGQQWSAAEGRWRGHARRRSGRVPLR